MEYILCSVPIKNEIWCSSVGRIKGKYENTEVTNKGGKNDDWLKIGRVL
jgi:hypothetical protein